MKVLIVDFAASKGGALSILNEYYDKAKKSEDDYIFLLSDNYIKETNNIKCIILKKEKQWINRLLFDYFLGRKIVKKINPDLVISLQNTIIRGIKTRQVLYVHQAIPFQNQKKFSLFKNNERKLAIIQYLIGGCIKSSIKKADSVIVQTNWMKRIIIKKCRVIESKIKIQKPTVDVSKIIKNPNIVKNKFFYPTANNIYKNNDIIYKAVALLKNEGIDDFEITLTIDGESDNNIKKIGRISKPEVLKKYSESILLFPSYIESFGLPLLEARLSNAIILASDTEFSREVLEGYKKAYYFNPFNEVELKELIKKIMNK